MGGTTAQTIATAPPWDANFKSDKVPGNRTETGEQGPALQCAKPEERTVSCDAACDRTVNKETMYLRFEGAQGYSYRTTVSRIAAPGDASTRVQRFVS
jgi:hypothetical protein